MKNPPAVWETWVQSVGWEEALEEGMATHSCILGNIPGQRNMSGNMPGKSHGQRSLEGYRLLGCRVRHNGTTKHSFLSPLQVPCKPGLRLPLGGTSAAGALGPSPLRRLAWLFGQSSQGWLGQNVWGRVHVISIRPSTAGGSSCSFLKGAVSPMLSSWMWVPS